MKLKTIGAAVLAGTMIVGCGKQAVEDEMAISVNGEKLMKSQVDADVELMVKSQGDKIPAEQLNEAKQMMANQIVQSFIVEKVLVNKAKAEGYTVTDADRKNREDEFLKAVKGMPDAPASIDEYFKKFPLGEARARTEFNNGIMIDKMIKAYQAKVPVKDCKAEAQKIVDNIISNNAKNVASDADALKKIKALKAELDKVEPAKIGEKFAALAKENSACPSSQKGGDLGEFTHGQMVKEFDEAAFSLPIGKVSEPVKTSFGYHLVLVTKKIPAVEAKGDAPAEPEKVQASHILIKVQEAQPVPTVEEVEKFMQKQDERRYVQEFVMNLVKQAKIEASEEYKHFCPPKEEVEDGDEETDEKAVEKSEKK